MYKVSLTYEFIFLGHLGLDRCRILSRIKFAFSQDR